MHWCLWLFLLCYCTNALAIDFSRNNACKQYISYKFSNGNPDCYHNPNVLSDLPSIVKRSGYKLETHTVATPDGFILTVFRIPAKQAGGQPVFMHHGIMTNPILWIDKFNQSMAFALNNAGYDVWLGNARGSTYSKSHAYLTVQDPNYWNFNMDVMAGVDLPAVLRYIGGVTGRGGSIIYLGHSMGTTLAFMYTASRSQEAATLLSGVVALAPVAYLHHNPVIKLVSPFSEIIRQLLGSAGIRGVSVNEDLIHMLGVRICRISPLLCLTINELAYGREPGQFAPQDLLLYFASWPDATAVDQLVQYLQIAHSERFQKFDYGTEMNMKMYGQRDPPLYNLSNIRVPMYLLRGLNDLLTPDQDVKRLYQEIGSNEKKLIEISKDGRYKFNHIDFIYAKDAQELLFPEILDIMQNNLNG